MKGDNLELAEQCRQTANEKHLKDMNKLLDVNAKKVDMVNSPPHYQLIPEKGVQTIDVIKATLTEEEFRGYCRGNAIKYMLRDGKKEGTDDKGKCMYYLRRT